MKINNNIAISGSGFLFNPVNGESFSVNPVGAEIISMLKDGKSIEHITKHILASYNMDEQTIEKDIYDFIGILKQYSLIEGDDKK